MGTKAILLKISIKLTSKDVDNCNIVKLQIC